MTDSFAALYGEDLGPSMLDGLDEAQTPHPRSSTACHASYRQRRDADAAQARRLTVLGEDAEVYADDLARQRVRDDLAHGRAPDRADQVRAARALQRRDPGQLQNRKVITVPKSSEDPRKGQAPAQAPFKQIPNTNQKPVTTKVRTTGRSPWSR